MNGDAGALSEAEKRGLKAFLKIDCKSCHDGILIGGETYEPLGKEHPYENQDDQGMYLLTGDENDRMFFKVAPLEEAVRKMGKLQLDEDLSDQQVNDITSFLKALTDKNREPKSK